MISAGAEEVNKLQIRGLFWFWQDPRCSQYRRLAVLVYLVVSHGLIHCIGRNTVGNLDLIQSPRPTKEKCLANDFNFNIRVFPTNVVECFCGFFKGRND